MSGALTRRHPPWPHELMTDTCKHELTSVVQADETTHHGRTVILQVLQCVDCFAQIVRYVYP